VSAADDLSDALLVVIIGLSVLLGIGIIHDPDRLRTTVGPIDGLGALIQAANVN
jgi:hypothetical protein